MQERERLPEPEKTEQPVAEQAIIGERVTPPWDEQVRALIARQEWLEPVANSVQGFAGRVLGALGPSVGDFLHGTWLRHPLHVALSDVPVGAWTAGVAMDVLDLGAEQPRLAQAADAALAVGVAAAVPTALSGMADWRHVHHLPRRVGLLHAALNSTGLLLQIASLVMRARGRRGQGVALSSAGYLATLTAAWLGGDLVEHYGIGVNRTAFQEGPKDFMPVMNAAALPERTLHKVEAAGVGVLLYQENGHIYAMADTCSHQGCSLAEGRVDRDAVVCACHGSTYHLADGTLVHGPSTFDQPRYDVRIRDGQIEVRQAPLA